MSNPEPASEPLPHLSHSRLQKYITCPEQYRLYYLERLRLKQEAAARVFGAVMHLALAEYSAKSGARSGRFAKSGMDAGSSSCATRSGKTGRN